MDDNQRGLNYFFKHRKLLIIALFAGGLLGVGITFTIPKKYLSTAIVYPYNPHTQDNLVFNPQFGYEVEAEQLLQLLESQSMRERTVAKFKLYDYYDLDTNDRAWRSKLALKYIQDVDFLRSKYLSVVINVETQDPQLSADIANYQVEEVNKYREDIFESNRQAEFKRVEDEYNELNERLHVLADSIYSIRGGKSELIYNYLENLNNENYDGSDFVNDPRLEPLIADYRFDFERLQQVRTIYEQLKERIEESLPSVYSVDRATASYKKVSPSFVMNGLLGAIVVFVLTLTLKLVLGKWKELKQGNEA